MYSPISASAGAITSGGASRSSNYKDIYDLLDRLCRVQVKSPQQQRDALRHVTQFISNCPTALGSTLPYDDATLVANITQQLEKQQQQLAAAHPDQATQEGGDATSAAAAAANRSNATLFLNLHEQLKSSQLDPHHRNALLTFLYYMADSKYTAENGFNRHTFANNNNNIRKAQSPQRLSTSPQRSIPLHTLRQQFTQKSSLFSDETSGFGGSSAFGLSRYTGHPTTLHLNSTYDISAKLSAFRSAASSSRATSDNDLAASATASINGGILTLPHSEPSKQQQLELQNSLNDDIVQNVIYSFTGIQGKYLKKDIISGKFKLDIKPKTLNVVQAGMLLRLSELGYYHDMVQSYTDSRRGSCALGLMGQGFVSALKTELTKFYGMVAMLQEQLNKQRAADQQQQQQQSTVRVLLPPNVRPERLTLMKILVWSVEPLQRLQWLSKIAEACQEKKGGALASTVYGFLCNGNPMVRSLARELLLAVCGPLYQMLTRWLLEGEICDPHAEFFIECLNEVGPDRLWHDKYRVRVAMLPVFITTELAHKMLVTGKSINFLCEICEDKQPVKGRDELRQCIEENAEHIFARVPDTKLHSTIDAIYFNTSKHVLDIVMGPHKLLEHLQAMRRYLLLGQGDFIGILMENLKFELDKPAKELYSYDLSSIMDAAIRSTNAQYEDPEILNHLDVRLMTPCDGDIGWDILSLQYTVRGPLATMLEPSMGIYQVLFKPLWRMKHMEFVLSAKIWKEQMCNTKLLRLMSAELKKVIYRLHLFTSEMIHFIHQMQYYILFEVIECSWAQFQERVQQANALDDILNAHDDFLTAIKCGAFLDATSRELSLSMESVYEGISHLEEWQDKFFELCFKELNARKQYEADIAATEQTGEFGVTQEKQTERARDRKAYEHAVHDCHKSLENIGSNYEKAVRRFLLTLNSNNDHNLQLFGIRLDFNEYYKKRDQRLGVPLTFEHMRLSNVYFSTSGNRSMHGSRYSGIN